MSSLAVTCTQLLRKEIERHSHLGDDYMITNLSVTVTLPVTGTYIPIVRSARDLPGIPSGLLR